jgi:hypothetical protein
MKKILEIIWFVIGPFFKAIWNFIHSLWVSCREILTTAAVLFGFFVLANVSAEWAKSDEIGLLALASLFAGVAKFCAISLTVFVLGIAISFPNTIGKFINSDFDEAWAELTPKAKLFTSLGVAGVLAIIATICFVF